MKEKALPEKALGAAPASSAAPRAARASIEAIWAILATVPDPEIPVISVVDLGIVRDVQWRDDDLVVTLTPTYSGCPATEVIMADIRAALERAGIADASIEMRLSPAWTTDWMNEGAKQRLRRYGIAPPHPCATDVAAQVGDSPPPTYPIDTSRLRRATASVACPRCGSRQTRELSRFGSTPCKAQYRCEDCREPFDYFKPH